MTIGSVNDANRQTTILVVEDNVGVRELAVEMLKMSGYQVIEAEDAKSGLAEFMAHPEIDLVFTDIIMPGGISGIEMAKDILNERPNALILLATGYQEKGNALKAHAAKSENVAAVSKPYDVNEIPKLIESMLARAATEPKAKLNA